MSERNLQDLIFNKAKELVKNGPGYAQERVVLRAVSDELKGKMPGTALEREQAILTCWHNLFRDGKLSWGYNVDNPNAPFFHIPSQAIDHR